MEARLLSVIADPNQLDSETKELFQDLADGQEDYFNLIQTLSKLRPENGAQLLPRIEALILSFQSNLTRMGSPTLSNICGFEEKEIQATLNSLLGLKVELLSRSTERKCNCCTSSETGLNLLYSSNSELFCGDCFKLLHPDSKLPEPALKLSNFESGLSPMSSSATSNISRCSFCDAAPRILRQINQDWLCSVCYEFVSIG